MFCYPARRRRALLLASTMIVPSIIISAARAQQAPNPSFNLANRSADPIREL